MLFIIMQKLINTWKIFNKNKESQFSKYFRKKCNEDSDERYFLEVDTQYPEKLHNFHNDLPERMKTEKLKNLQLTCMVKKNILYS